MKRFKNILFFIDSFDELDNLTPSLERAFNLAKDNDARLTLIDVIEPIETPQELKARHKIDLTQVLVEDRQVQLEELIKRLPVEDNILYSKVLTGIPFIEVIKYAQRGTYDLLMKMAKPPADLGERLLGSNDLHLLRKCPFPVLIDKPNCKKSYDHILATVELEPSHEKSCDEKVMQLAVSLAERENAEVHVAHAWRLLGESTFRSGRLRIPESEVFKLLEQEEAQHRGNLNTLLADFRDKLKEVNVHMLKGETSAIINQVADVVQADVIIMGTVGRVGIPGLFIGNTAEDILQATQASILAVKPEGFVSPVQ